MAAYMLRMSALGAVLVCAVHDRSMSMFVWLAIRLVGWLLLLLLFSMIASWRTLYL